MKREADALALSVECVARDVTPTARDRERREVDDLRDALFPIRKAQQHAARTLTRDDGEPSMGEHEGYRLWERDRNRV
ncbi:hypothetical protein [Burkholderia sp. BCC1993]|uniref:hypothetical protein n=1 Tax=Burkholderia sp. BCC1993 TaxID=2817444 RepID=UPI002AB1021C|nr:hypothetical protein [Burkholderia sp. BCC1993]